MNEQTTQGANIDIEFQLLERILIDPLSLPNVASFEAETISFLITKDHPQRLQFTLPLLAAASDRVYVLDSSRGSDTRNLCSALGFPSVRYHGPQEQDQAFSLSPVLQRALASGFLTKFSDDCWDIWSKRNYALVFSLLNEFSRILLIDDDVITSKGLIQDAISLSGTYSLIGAKICGMPDRSVVGHICLLLNLVNQRFISGHFLAVNVSSAAAFYFPNVYNEDWIFMLLNSLNAPIARYGTIFHLYWNPYDETGGRAAFEEKGEILIEGLARLILSGAGITRLGESEHWEGVICERRQKLDKLTSTDVVRSSPALKAILECCRSVASRLRPGDFVSFWNDYNNKVGEWRAIINLARSSKGGFIG